MKRILRKLGVGVAPIVNERFEPVYGLPWASLEKWLAKNPSKEGEYAAELDRRSRRCRIDFGKIRRINRRRSLVSEHASRN